MSDTGNSSNDPYDPNRPPSPPAGQEPPSGSQPQPGWGGGAMSSGQWGSAQPPQYSQGQYGQGQYGQGQGQYGQGYGVPPGTPPPNYLVPGILATVFCCLPLGIASIVFAAQVNSKFSAGDIAGAQDASRKAKQFAIWSVVAGVVVVALYGIFIVLALASGTSTSGAQL